MNLQAADLNNNNSKGVSYWSGFLMTIGFALIGFVISGAVLGIFIKGDVNAFKNPANANFIRIAQTLTVIVSMFLPAVFAAMMLNKKPFQLLGFTKNIEGSQVAFTLLIAFTSIIVAGSLGYLTKELPIPAEWKLEFDKLEDSYMEQVGIIMDLKTVGGYLLSLVLIAFLPALCEEVLFRGGLQNFLTKATSKPWLSIIIISILFSLVHFSFYGFIARMFLGIMLGAIFYYTKNIWLSILAHFFNNALAVTVAFVMTQQGKTMKDAMNEDFSGAYFGLLGIPVLILTFIQLKNISKKNLVIDQQ